MREQETTVRLVAFLFQMWNPERWDLTRSMTWANTTKTGSIEGTKLVGQQVDGALTWTKRGHQVPLEPLKKHCQSNWRCTKVTTSAATSPPLQKTGGCCTRTTAPLGPPSREVSSRWSTRRGISAELSTYLSLLLCLYPCACQPLSAPIARHAEVTLRTKQLLWSRAKRAQNRAATVQRATLSPNWKPRNRKEQRRTTQRSRPLESCQRVRRTSFSAFLKWLVILKSYMSHRMWWKNTFFIQIRAKKWCKKVEEGRIFLNWNHWSLQMWEKAKMQRHLLGKSCTTSP